MANHARSRKILPSSRAAWFIFGIAVVLNVLAIALIIMNPRIPITTGWGVRGLFTVSSLLFGFLGALILARYPWHRIGWLFNGLGLLLATMALLQEYSYYAVFAQPDIAASGVLAAWGWNWLWIPGVPIFMSILLLFPDGNLPSPGWQVLIWLAIANSTLRAITVATTPGPLIVITSINNPLGIENAAAFLETAFTVTTAVASVFLTIASLSLILRFRRVRGSERQQIKWFLYAVVLIFPFHPTVRLDFPWNLAILLAFIFIPVSAVIAIFRYRLYDIDIIIRRTLVYSILSILMALIYFGSVVLFQSLFRSLTGQGSQLSVVASTLTIAALFNPLGRRIQDIIDRRFYRRKYDAENTLAAFAATVRDEVDLDRLAAAVLTGVEETMQPQQVALWLMEPDQ